MKEAAEEGEGLGYESRNNKNTISANLFGTLEKVAVKKIWQQQQQQYCSAVVTLDIEWKRKKI